MANGLAHSRNCCGSEVSVPTGGAGQSSGVNVGKMTSA